MKEIVAVSGAIPSSPTIVTLGSGFSFPQGIAVNGSGNVFVSDTVNDAVKEVQLNGVQFGSAAVATITPTQVVLPFTCTTAGTLGMPAVMTL